MRRAGPENFTPARTGDAPVRDSQAMSSRQKQSVVHFPSPYKAGDEIVFRFDGLLTGRITRVRFRGRKVVYEMTVALECEVPASAVVGRESDILGSPEDEEGICAK